MLFNKLLKQFHRKNKIASPMVRNDTSPPLCHCEESQAASKDDEAIFLETQKPVVISGVGQDAQPTKDRNVGDIPECRLQF